MAGFGRQIQRLRESDRFSPRPGVITEQLRALRSDPRHRPERPFAGRVDPEPLPPGEVVRTRAGCHYRMTNEYPDPHSHGAVRLGRFSDSDFRSLLGLAGLPADSGGREAVVFLDTETTGVHVGTGMCPFLIGIGFYRGDRFEIRQFFVRDFDEEASMLTELGDWLREFTVLVTYNGKTFDVPIVDSRCVLARVQSPFAHMRHLDLLHMTRRLWKASHGSCKLTYLEERLARFLRGPDIHGSKIPFAYFDYLRAGDTGTLNRVFSHNADDILSLAALTILASDRVVSEPARFDDPREIYSLGRLFDRSRSVRRSIRCYRMAVDSDSLPSDLRTRALERLSVLYRRIGRIRASLDCCDQLMAGETFSFVGYEGAAICHERFGKDPVQAHRVLCEAIERVRCLSGATARATRLQERRSRLLRRYDLPGNG